MRYQFNGHELERLKIFLAEAMNHLRKIADEALQLKVISDTDQSRLIIEGILRELSLLKGAAAFFGLMEMLMLIRQAQALLEAMCAGQLRVEAEVINVVLDVKNILVEMINEFGAASTVLVNEEVTIELVCAQDVELLSTFIGQLLEPKIRQQNRGGDRIMEKKLTRPNSTVGATATFKGGAGIDSAEQMVIKRDLAKRKAVDKVRARTLAKQQQLAERIATATEQVASGIEEASTAAAELASAMTQIATGSEEAASAAEECRAAVNQIEKAAIIGDERAKESLERVNIAHNLVRTTSNDIEILILGVKNSANTNIESGKMVAELENQSAEVGNIVEAVVRIADQTNLLALNAAIEAARAGEHGRGFAVVADEVRNLAEISEKSARDIRALVDDIQENVKIVVNDVEQAGSAANSEVEKAKKITADLDTIEKDAVMVQEGVSEVVQNAKNVMIGSKDFLAITQQVAAASEEQGAATEEITNTIAEQNKAFHEMNIAANELAQLAEQLKVSTDAQKSSEELASAAEEMSANVEEASTAAGQIMQTMEQLGEGARIQAEMTAKGSSIAENLAAAALQMKVRAGDSQKKATDLQAILTINKQEVDDIIKGISGAAEASLQSAKNIKRLEDITRRIDKIVDAIVNVTIQTNMLAVNGSIEAARAGEYGRGFSVVASDIRTLANESADNADKIKDLVRNIQNKIQQVTADIELSAKTAMQEVENAKKSNQNLNAIEAAMAVILTNVGEIFNGADESLIALEQAKRGIEQISVAAQEAEKANMEATLAAQEQAKGMQELAEAIEEISGLADELQNM